MVTDSRYYDPVQRIADHLEVLAAEALERRERRYWALHDRFIEWAVQVRQWDEMRVPEERNHSFTSTQGIGGLCMSCGKPYRMHDTEPLSVRNARAQMQEMLERNQGFARWLRARSQDGSSADLTMSDTTSE